MVRRASNAQHDPGMRNGVIGIKQFWADRRDTGKFRVKEQKLQPIGRNHLRIAVQQHEILAGGLLRRDIMDAAQLKGVLVRNPFHRIFREAIKISRHDEPITDQYHLKARVSRLCEQTFETSRDKRRPTADRNEDADQGVAVPRARAKEYALVYVWVRRCQG